MPLVSVIIPVYNVENYIRRCLNSVISQTWTDIEIICVNGGSTDNSLDILLEYIEKDERIIIVDQANQGVSVARNAGLKIAQGELIAFIDSDDWIHEQYFELLVNAQRQTNADCVVCGVMETSKENVNKILYDKDDIKIMSNDLSTAFANIMTKTRIWGRVYKRALLCEHSFINGITFAEDTIFNLSVLCGRDDIVVSCIHEKLYYYYFREESAIRTLEHRMVGFTVPHSVHSYEKIGKSCNRIYLLDQAYKAYFTSRYLYMFQTDKEERAMLKLYGKRIIKYICDFSFTKRWMYILFYYVPLTYRLGRIMEDPSMLLWEREQRKLYRSSLKMNR